MLKNHSSSTTFTARATGAAIAGVALSLLASASLAPASATQRPGSHATSELRAEAQQIIDAGATGVQVRLDAGRKANNRVSRVSLGFANDHGRKLTGNERFRAGSVSKLVTSTAVLQLAERGRVDLDATVERYLPGKLTDGSRITLRQLLNHTSGFPVNAYEGQLPYDPETVTTRDGMQAFLAQSYSDGQLLGYINDTGLVATPGSKFEYSNANYVILGQVITAVTGQPYQRYIERNIFRPLQMNHSTFPLNSTTVKRPAAIGYLPASFYGGPSSDPPLDVSGQHNSLFGASGSLITTTKDLNRFLQGLFAGKLLSHKSLDQMMQASEPGDVTYGLGVLQIKSPCGVIRGHNGSVYGYQTTAFYLNGKSIVSSVTEGTKAYGALADAQLVMSLSALCPQTSAGSATKNLAPGDHPSPH